MFIAFDISLIIHTFASKLKSMNQKVFKISDSQIKQMYLDGYSMKDIAKIIGTRIKMLRFAKHMQQTELAKRMGISQTHMSNIESGRNNVTVDNLYKLHEILGCSMSSFFVDIDGKEEPKENNNVFSLEDLTQALILLKKQ